MKSIEISINCYSEQADRTREERKAMLGIRKSSTNSQALKQPQADASSLPKNVDWRLMGAVTPVKDQGICGSCWSFSVAGSLEGSLFLKNKQLVDLSQSQLMDCSWGEGNFVRG